MMQNKHKPLFLNPAWLVMHGCVIIPDRFAVYAVPYPGRGKVRQWQHKTLRAAGRRMGSVISGKLRNRGDSAVFCWRQTAHFITGIPQTVKGNDMTQAITVKFHGPTNTRQARVVASAWGKRHSESYSHALQWGGNAAHCAMAAAEKWGWKGKWIAGCPNGAADILVFVSVDKPDASFDLGE